MAIDKDLVRRHFSRSADQYDDVSQVQKVMAAALLAACLEARPAAAIADALEFGCGTGELTAGLHLQLPAATHLTVNDLAPAMIAQAQARLGTAAARPEWVAADAEAWLPTLPAASRDLVISSATVQWFAAPLGTVEAGMRLLRPGGVLGLATFGPDTFCELRRAFRRAEAQLGLPPGEHTLRFDTAAAWQAAADAVGAEATVTETQVLRRFATLADFLRVIRRCGASLAGRAEQRQVNRALYTALVDAYEAHRDPADGLLPATFHVVQLVARRPAVS